MGISPEGMANNHVDEGRVHRESRSLFARGVDSLENIIQEELSVFFGDL